MTKREFVMSEAWRKLPMGAELIGTLFSRSVTRKRVGVGSAGMIETGTEYKLLFSSNRVEDES